jgi:hypothetical protein
MKKYVILTILSIFTFSCAGPTPEPGDEPLNLADGKLIIKFTDPKLEAKNSVTIAKDEILSVSFNVKKAVDGSYPVKLSAYITDNSEKKGILMLDNIRLKNTDDQTQSLEVVPPEVGIIVSRIFYVEITDSKGKITRKALGITPLGTKQISAWSNITLGVQGSGVPDCLLPQAIYTRLATWIPTSISWILPTQLLALRPLNPLFCQIHGERRWA